MVVFMTQCRNVRAAVDGASMRAAHPAPTQGRGSTVEWSLSCCGMARACGFSCRLPHDGEDLQDVAAIRPQRGTAAE